MTLDIAAGGDKISVFGGDIKFEVPLKAGADFAPKPGDAITVTIDYQGCNNNECLRPASVSTSVALAAPAVCGLKVIVNGRLWPAAMVTGRDRPPRENTELFVVAAVTVTLAPVAVKLPDADPLVPSTTLPRASVLGETPSCPTTVVPLPERETVSVGAEASEVMVTLPLSLAAEDGANSTPNVVL